MSRPWRDLRRRRRQGVGRAGPSLLGVAAVVSLLAVPVLAAIPDAQRVVKAAALRNREAGRATGLQISVVLRFEDSDEPAAEGTLWSHPDGRVGLELRARAGFVERHLLQRGRPLASRNGLQVASPRPFLPPFPLFQPRSSGGLATGLRTLGVDTTTLALGYEGDHDCYVIGGRAAGRPALWIDQETHDPVRIDRGDGVHWRAGPTADLGDIALPSYIEVESASGPRARLEFAAAAPAELPTLDASWLSASASP